MAAAQRRLALMTVFLPRENLFFLDDTTSPSGSGTSSSTTAAAAGTSTTATASRSRLATNGARRSIACWPTWMTRPSPGKSIGWCCHSNGAASSPGFRGNRAMPRGGLSPGRRRRSWITGASFGGKVSGRRSPISMNSSCWSGTLVCPKSSTSLPGGRSHMYECRSGALPGASTTTGDPFQGS